MPSKAAKQQEDHEDKKEKDLGEFNYEGWIKFDMFALENCLKCKCLPESALILYLSSFDICN